MSNPHIVVIHGLGRTRFSMLPLAYRLTRRGYPSSTVSYYSRWQTIEKASEKVSTEIDRLRPDVPLVFVGHSLGGRLACQLAHRYQERTKSLVLLGPALGRSESAAIGCKLGIFRIFFGPVLRQLAETEESTPPDGIPVGIVFGEAPFPWGYNPLLSKQNDFLVNVEETDIWPVSARKRTLVPHPLMMFSNSIVDEIVQFIEREEFSEEETKA